MKTKWRSLARAFWDVDRVDESVPESKSWDNKSSLSREILLFLIAGGIIVGGALKIYFLFG